MSLVPDFSKKNLRNSRNFSGRKQNIWQWKRRCDKRFKDRNQGWICPFLREISWKVTSSGLLASCIKLAFFILEKTQVSVMNISCWGHGTRAVYLTPWLHYVLILNAFKSVKVVFQKKFTNSPDMISYI